MAEIACDNLKARYTKIFGIREKLLNTALDSIKVVRQAFHGNVMVGNHCHIVLKKFKILTHVVNGKPNLDVKFNELLQM